MAKRKVRKTKDKKAKDTKPKREKTATEKLHEKQRQSGPDAMAATPTAMPAEVTSAAVYSTGPGDVVAYDYQRTGTYADEYNNQQQVEVQGQDLAGPGQVPAGALNP